MTWTLVLICAAVGGLIRFLSEYKFPPIGPSAFPRATLAVNVVGSFILGLTYGHHSAVAIGAGFCGALTTFSGVSLQVHRRITAGAWRQAMFYFVVLVTAGLLAAWGGLQIGGAI
jgi:CrcB protein